MTDLKPTEPTTSAPDRRLLLGLAVAAVVGAAALPVWRVGAGWMVAALAVLATVAIARAARSTHGGGAGKANAENTGPGAASSGLRSEATQERSDEGRRSLKEAGARASEASAENTAWRLAAAVAAFALIAVAGVRAAGWLVALCLLTGVPLGSYALVGGRTWRGILGGALAVLPAIGPARAWATERLRLPQAGSHAGRIIGGVVVGAVLVALFGSLFSAADPAFADLLREWRASISVDEVMRGGIGLVAVPLFAVAAAYLVSVDRATEPSTSDRKALGVIEWAVPLAMLDVLFGVFVFVQVTVLFGDDSYVLAPGGPDYAVYARGGFVQLIAVTVLTLGIVSVLAVWAGRRTDLERTVLRVLGGALCLLTLVIVTSALKRLGLYAQAYGFNVPRLLGYAAEAWLGLVFGLVIIAGVRLRVDWLPRAIVAAGVAILLGLAAINPEALMARTHIARLDQNYGLDLTFLATLSADALDELNRLPEPARSCALARLRRTLGDSDPWYGYNLSRESARHALATGPTSCERQSG